MNTFVFEAFDHIPKHLQSEVEAGKKRAFHEDEALNTLQKRQVHEDKFCSQLDRFKYLLAFDSKHVVGGITLLSREIQFEGRQLLLGGIAAVWTKSEYENQKIASTLLQKSMEILKEKGADIAYLCTDVENPARLHLYGKVGFVPLGKLHTYVGKSGKRYSDNDGMIAPVCSPTIFKQIMESKTPLDLGVGNW